MEYIDSPRPIYRELHNVFMIVRQLMADNLYILNSIDESYEHVLFMNLELVPQQFDTDILKTLTAIKAILSNINFSAISAAIDDITGGILSFQVNTYEMFNSAFNKFSMEKRDKIRIQNIVSKFKPLFAAIDTMLASPLVYIRKIASLTDTSNMNVF